MTKSDALRKYIQKVVKECAAERLTEGGMGKLSRDASDALDGLIYKYKGKSATDILKILLTDPNYADMFLPEIQQMKISGKEMLSYIKDAQTLASYSLRGEGLANMYMPPSVADTEGGNIKAI